MKVKVKIPTCQTFTANHISLSTLNVCTNNVDEINASDKVSKAEKSIYAFILAMVGQKGFVKLSMQSAPHHIKCTMLMQSAPCQCKVHHINAKCTMSMQSASHQWSAPCQCKAHHINAKCTMSMQNAPHECIGNKSVQSAPHQWCYISKSSHLLK